MNRDSRKVYGLILITILFIVYLFFAAEPLDNEFILNAAWINNTNPVSFKNNPGEKMIPFKLGNTFGYVYEGGNLALSMELSQSGNAVANQSQNVKATNVTLSESAYSIWSVDQKQVNVISPDGSIIFKSDKSGLPFFSDDRRFLVFQGMDSIGEFCDDGTLAWTYRYPSVITAFDSTKDYAVAGLLDGSVEVVDNNGKMVFSFETGGSRIPVIYGLSISENGKLIALLCGHDKQRFIMLEKRRENFRIAHHKYLDSEYRFPVTIRFSEDGKYVFFPQPGKVVVFDTTRETYGSFKIDSTDFDIFTESTQKFIIISALVSDGRRILCIDPPTKIIFECTLPYDVSFATVKQNSLYIGGNDQIARIDFKVE